MGKGRINEKARFAPRKLIVSTDFPTSGWAMDQAHAPRPAQAALGLWDTVSLIVGIIIGVGIFKAPGDVFPNLGGPWAVLGAWTLGGILSLVGALCFAELASTYPRSGGEYVYLTRAYGSAMGFLFGWAQLAVIRTGAGIAALAYIVAA